MKTIEEFTEGISDAELDKVATKDERETIIDGLRETIPLIREARDIYARQNTGQEANKIIAEFDEHIKEIENTATNIEINIIHATPRDLLQTMVNIGNKSDALRSKAGAL